jgi:hypothetical protein
MSNQRRQAWVKLPSDDELRRMMAGPAPSTPPAKHPYNFGFSAGMSRLMRAHERIGRAYGRLFLEVMATETRLTRREKEMVAAVAAAAQDCHY